MSSLLSWLSCSSLRFSAPPRALGLVLALSASALTACPAGPTPVSEGEGEGGEGEEGEGEGEGDVGEGEGDVGEGEGEGEACVPACTAGFTCREGACLADTVFCAPEQPTGVCADPNQSCVGGACVDVDDACGVANPTGSCADGLVCDDGVCVSDAPCAVSEPAGFCAAGLACVDGRCQERDRLCSLDTPTGLCSAGNVCVDGTCVPVEAQCGCVGNEVCVDGVCRTPAALCSAENPAGVCDAGAVCVAGGCVDVGARCSAQNPTGVCPPGSLCDDGVCAGVDGAALCDDDNACTVDAFDPIRNRCAHEPRSGACDDGNACTTDVCGSGATEGQCIGAPIGGCIEPPVLDPVTSPTNVGSLVIRGTKPAGASVVINELTAAPESPDTRWQVTVNLVPGDNVYVVKSVDQGASSATRELHVVYDITPPHTRVTPDGGSFLAGVTATIATDEPATVFFTTDGSDPTEDSPQFRSLQQLRVFTSTHLRLRAKDVAGNLEANVVDVLFDVSGRGTSWREGPGLAEGVVHAAAALVGDDVYVAGGSDGQAAQAGVVRISADGNRASVASLAVARAGLTLVTHSDGTLFAIGGENAGVPKNTVEALASGATAWVTRAPMPSTRFALSAVSVNDKIFVFGGKANGGAVVNNVEVYDPAANTWSNNVAQMPRARAGGRAVVVAGLVFVVGGEDDSGVPVAAVDVYDPSRDAWSTRAPLPTPRSFAAVGVIGNDGRVRTGQRGIVVAGGLGLGGTATAVVEEYLVDDDVWVERAPLDSARYAAAAVDVHVLQASEAATLDDRESEIFVIGGQVGDQVVNSGRVFRSPRDWARRLADLPAARFLAGAGVVDETVYVIGGRSFREETVGYAYDPETGSASELPPLASVQSGPAVIAVAGRVFVVGGADGFGNAVATNRAYDPAEHRYVELQPMTSARAVPAVAALGGVGQERLVVVGGDNGGALQTVELYDVAHNRWSTGPLLPRPRKGASAVAYRGDVYVVGGVDSAGVVDDTIVKSTRDAAGNLTGWQTLSGSIPVAFGVAVVERDALVVIPGRAAGALDGEPFVYDLGTRTVRLREALQASLVPGREKRAGVSVLGKLLLIGGVDDTLTSGASAVVEARLSCLNNVLDVGETSIDDGDGCVHATDGIVRIVGTATRGRLEVLRNGVFGTICDDSFDDVDATVACRSLGFSSGHALGSFGGGTLDIVMDDVACTGSETLITQCPFNPIHNCSHSEDVGVECTP